MKVKILADFDEILTYDMDIDYPFQIEVAIDIGIRGKITPIPPNTIRFFVTSQPEGDYNKLIIDNPDCYDYLLTSFDSLLKLPKARFFMGCTSFFEPDPNIEKKFGVSTVMSGRNNLPGHKLRRELFERQKEVMIPFDFYLGTHNRLSEDFYKKGIELPALKSEKKRVFNRMFHVAIDSYNDPVERSRMFSEKLIDCFITKTIPFYWGTPMLEEFFNMDGIIKVNNVDDIIWHCNQIRPWHYELKREAVEDNYNRALKYWNYGDLLKETIINVLNAHS